MEEQEGVIKYRLVHEQNNRIPSQTEFLELESWRQVLFQLGFLGQDPNRYGGLSYGNISIRNHQDEIWVSGSQTSGFGILQPNQYVHVLSANIENNELVSEGNAEPSSEAMSHMALYQVDASVRAVVHIHEPTLWCYGHQRLSLPEIDKTIAYGTPEMAKALQRVVQSQNGKSGLVVMKGHQDGVIAFGSILGSVSSLLISMYQKAVKARLSTE